MMRLIAFLVFAIALAWGVVWVADNPGQVSLQWGAWRIDTSVGVLGAGVALFAILVALLYRLWLFLTRAPERIGQAYREHRSHKGYKALTKGMVAVAAGDPQEASRQVGKADGLLREPPLTLLLKAQAAQLNGDESAAETFFKAMLEDPEMEFLGLRGLINQAVKAGDHETALSYARRAQGLNPKGVWLSDTLFMLEARAGHWDRAGKAVAHADKIRHVPRGEARHHQAMVILGQSVTAERAGDQAQALKLAEKAVAEDPALVPAMAHFARLLLAADRARKAKSALEKAWPATPHPDLAGLYFEARAATDGLKKVAAAQKLLDLNPDAADSHLAMAAAALEAQLWGQARTHLEQAMEAGRATRTVFTLLARLENEERGDRDKAQTWLARAASAAADPAWVCSACGHAPQHWSPHCPKCEGFDTLAWETPPGFGALAEALTHESRKTN